MMIAPEKHISEWEIFWEEGQTYTHLCGLKAKHFNNEIRYNLAAMAIEKLVMGYLMRQNSLPDGHTLRDLVEAVEKALPVPEQLCADIRQMDDFQQICAFDTYTRTVPTDAEMTDIVVLVEKLNQHLTTAMP